MYSNQRPCDDTLNAFYFILYINTIFFIPQTYNRIMKTSRHIIRQYSIVCFDLYDNYNICIVCMNRWSSNDARESVPNPIMSSDDWFWPHNHSPFYLLSGHHRHLCHIHIWLKCVLRTSYKGISISSWLISALIEFKYHSCNRFERSNDFHLLKRRTLCIFSIRSRYIHSEWLLGTVNWLKVREYFKYDVV